MNLIAHYFIPRRSNDHKAKIIRSSGLSLVLVLVLLIQFFVKTATFVNPQILGFAASISPDEVIRLTNEKRAQNGLPTLNPNTQLSEAARQKASDMINKDYWAHVAPDGTEPWNFFRNVGYRYKFAGENLARDFSNPVSTVDAWMASSSHRENMLSSKYKEIGVAVIDGDMGGVDTTIVVQLFGTRVGDTLSTQPVAAKTQESAAPIPTKTPLPIAEVELVNTPQPLSQPSKESERVLVSPLNVTKSTSGIIVGVLLGVLLIDMIIISRRRISRVSGRPFAHFAFFVMILAIILIIRAGRII